MKKIIVGIPSLNSAETIGFVTKQIADGLLKYFLKYKKDYQTEIVNIDGGSTDKTSKIFLDTNTKGIEKISLKEPKPHGKGQAQKMLFKIIQKEKAIAGATLDSDLKSITPKWIKGMLEPILTKNFDYVTPLYLRHKYDGTITNTIAYPLTTALYGKEIRQPIGGDFAFSGKLVKYWLSQEIPHDFGIDIFMTTTALVEDFKICQVYLGPKIHDPKDPHELTSMFVEVTNELFKLARTYKNKWLKITKIQKVPIFGQKSSQKPPKVQIDLKKLKKYDRISKDAWVKTVYGFLISERPVEKLIPYYLRAVASLIFDNWKPDDLIKEFLKQKPYEVMKVEGMKE